MDRDTGYSFRNKSSLYRCPALGLCRITAHRHKVRMDPRSVAWAGSVANGKCGAHLTRSPRETTAEFWRPAEAPAHLPQPPPALGPARPCRPLGHLYLSSCPFSITLACPLPESQRPLLEVSNWAQTGQWMSCQAEDTRPHHAHRAL